MTSLRVPSTVSYLLTVIDTREPDISLALAIVRHYSRYNGVSDDHAVGAIGHF